MSVKRVKQKTGRPIKVPGEKGTKERIFDAAVDLFAEKGFDGVSIRDIGRAVGITEGAVYKHYSGKDEILDSIFAYVENRIYSQAPERSFEALLEAASFRDILQSMPQAMVADALLNKVTRIMIIEMYHNEKIRNYVSKELFERPAKETDALFRKLMEKGKIRPCDPGAMATLFISYLVYWYFETFVFSHGRPEDIENQLMIARSRINAFADMLEPLGSPP